MSTMVLILEVFFVCFVLHVSIHRILAQFSKKSLLSLGVYSLGCLYLIGTPVPQYPVSAVFLYVALWLLTSVFYLTPYLGGETPASMILAALKEKRLTEKQIIRLFTKEGLLSKRIADLEDSRCVKKDGIFVVLRHKGYLLARCIGVYQKLFNRVLTG